MKKKISLLLYSKVFLIFFFILLISFTKYISHYKVNVAANVFDIYMIRATVKMYKIYKKMFVCIHFGELFTKNNLHIDYKRHYISYFITLKESRHKVKFIFFFLFSFLLFK